MTYIARHEVDAGKFQARIESLEPDLEPLYEKLGTKNVIVERIFTESLMVGQLYCAIDPNAETAGTGKHLRAALDAGSGLFIAANGPAEAVDYKILDHDFQLKRTGPRRYHKAGNWLTTLWLAISLKDHNKIDSLISTTVDDLRSSGAEYDDFIYSWIESLQKFFRNDPTLEDSFVAAMDGTEPSAVSATSEEVLLDLLYPPIEMFYFLLRRDSAQFNESLERALKAHRRYWTKADRKTNSEGMIALAPLAVAALAKQSGLDVEVSSEYLPQRLLMDN